MLYVCVCVVPHFVDNGRTTKITLCTGSFLANGRPELATVKPPVATVREWYVIALLVLLGFAGLLELFFFLVRVCCSFSLRISVPMMTRWCRHQGLDKTRFHTKYRETGLMNMGPGKFAKIIKL